MQPAIELSHLTRRYGHRRGVIDVTFDVAEGEAFGFLGPNGAGKTTTIRVLMGYLRPSEGRATIFGHDCWAEAPLAHRDMAFVGSEPAYLGDVPAADQLDALGRLRGLERGAWRRLAERLELDPTIQVRKLSRGNRQKVAIVQAFMGRERLLVLDEPTTGLDPVMQREFLALMAEARAAGQTVFLSSHNLPEVERCCDRVGIVREGRLVDVASVQALLASHWRAVNLVLGSPPPPDAFAIPNVRVLAINGLMVHLMIQGEVNELLRRLATLDVRDVSIATPDIEDVFLGFYEAQTPDSVPRDTITGGTPAEAVR